MLIEYKEKSIYEIFTSNSNKNKVIFRNFLHSTYLKENIENIKINKMFKLLNNVYMIFTQFFLKKEKFSQININLFIIFLYIIYDLGINIKNIKTIEQKKVKINLDFLCYDILQILSYLCLKNNENEYQKIFNNIIRHFLPKEEFSYFNNTDNPFHSVIVKYSNNQNLKFSSIFEENNNEYINIENINSNIKELNNDNIWENNFINLYYYYYYSTLITFQKKYIKIKKELFSWNGIYSNKILFYTDKRKEFKYKISTHLTQSFINPILIPILDFNYYTSNQYKSEDLFLEQFKSYINLSIFPKKEIKIKNITNYLTIPCCLIKLTHHIKGFILIKVNNPNYFEFFNCEEGGNDKNDPSSKLCYGSYKNIDNNKSYYIKIFINDINMIFERKYYYSNNSIEIFTNQNKSYYFNFGIKKEDENNKINFLKLITKNLKKGSIIKPPYNISKKNIPNIYINSKILDNYINFLPKWINGEISTFTFLNILNLLSNRSLKDLTQYPVFPWITHDNSIQTENEYLKIRQLNKPMGLITLDLTKNENSRLAQYIDNFEIFKKEIDDKYKHYKMEDFYNDDNIQYDNIPYIYGSHYSNPAYVCHYLTRVFPFTFTAWSIQGTSFDAPDRLFINIEKSYRSSVISKCDLREIIPQFFYFPEIFFNSNNLKLGKLQKNKDKNSTYNILKKLYNIKDNENVYVNDVLLPKWCNNNPYQFVSIYRELLELLKEDINEWINLIFGIYSRGEKAKEKYNLFMCYSYNDIMDKKLKLIKDDSEKECVLKLAELGLVPSQTLYERIILNENKKVNDKGEKNEMIFNIKSGINLSDIKYVFKGIIDNIIYLYDNNLNYIKIDLKYNNNSIKEGKIENIQKEILNLIYISKGDFIIALSNDNYLYKIKNLKNTIINKDNNLDKSIISIIYVDKNENNLYIGTNNGSIIIYNINEIILKDKLFNPSYYLYHSDKINCIDVNNELNILIDSSNDGYINLYTLPKMEIVNSIYKEDIVKNIFLSSSPLPSFVIYINNKFDCYNINCENINTQSPYYNIIIEDDKDFINNNKNINENNHENNDNILPKICKINYFEYSINNYLEKKSNLNNAIVITNNHFVDFLLYEMNHYIILRKFPYMIITQIIKINIPNRCLVLENLNNITIFNLEINEHQINVKSINKSKIGNIS